MECHRSPLLRVGGDAVENIKNFRKDIDAYFALNNLWNKRRVTQVSRLLNLLEEEALVVYYTLEVSRNSEATVEDIINAFEEYYTPRKNATFDIVKFIDRFQDPLEPFDDFLRALKELIAPCRLGVHEDQVLAAQIINGIFNKSAQAVLLQKERTLDEVIEFCRNFEKSSEGGKPPGKENVEPKPAQEPRKFVLVKTNDRPKRPKKCGRCDENHPPEECIALNTTCNICNKMGHLAICCRDRYENLIDDDDDEEIMECIGILCIDPKDSALLQEIESALSGKGGNELTEYMVTGNPYRTNASEANPESGLCRICFAKPQNGLFVHNRISHVYGCYSCARKIFRTSGHCPICRRKISKVTKLFLS